MSFFSDINGFNSKSIKNYYETKDDKNTDFSEVDFCIDSEDELFAPKVEEKEKKQSNTAENLQARIEEYMYNYDMTAQEAEDFINKNMNLEG